MALEKHSIQERESKMKKGTESPEAEQSIEMKAEVENVLPVTFLGRNLTIFFCVS